LRDESVVLDYPVEVTTAPMDLQSILLNFGVTVLIMVSVAAVSVLAFVSETVKRALILNPYRVRRGEVHRLLTAGWVHADVTHLALNLLVLFMFADRVVAKLGPLGFAALYVSAVVVGFLPTTVRHWNRPAYNSLGASGAVAAIMFSAILLYPRMKLSLLFLPIPVPGVVFGVLYMAYSAWRSYEARDGINHDAHFSGALYGVLVTVVVAPSQVERTVLVMRQMVGL
jgi:membrane associated rhomboid family serine protease